MTNKEKKIMEKLSKSHYIIDTMLTPEGKLELWESTKYGDEKPCIVTLDGYIIGKTWDPLSDYYKCEILDA